MTASPSSDAFDSEKASSGQSVEYPLRQNSVDGGTNAQAGKLSGHPMQCNDCPADECCSNLGHSQDDNSNGPDHNTNSGLDGNAYNVPENQDSGIVGRVLSRVTVASKSSYDPGPPPDGGLLAWTQCKLMRPKAFMGEAKQRQVDPCSRVFFLLVLEPHSSCVMCSFYLVHRSGANLDKTTRSCWSSRHLQHLVCHAYIRAVTKLR
jgi:hypothetical protein